MSLACWILGHKNTEEVVKVQEHHTCLMKNEEETVKVCGGNIWWVETIQKDFCIRCGISREK